MRATFRILSSLSLICCVAGWGQPRGAMPRTGPSVPFHTVVSGTDTHPGSAVRAAEAATAVLGITPGGVLNSANPVPGAALAPGSMVTVQGNFPGIASVSVDESPLPTTFGRLSMQFIGPSGPLRNAPLFYVSPGQVNLQLPWELAVNSPTSLVANISSKLGDSTSPSEPVALAAFAPGLFSVNGLGTGQGAILDASYEIVDTRHPAVAGSTLLRIYCTGLGAVTNQPASGSPASDLLLATTTTTPTLTIGGADAKVLFSGLVPGFVGLYEVDATVPGTSSKGDSVSVVLSIGGAVSNTVTVAVSSTPAVFTPVITSVDPVPTEPTPLITIHGHGFGNEAPLGFHSSHISLGDSTAKWTLSGDFNMRVVSWTDTEIQVICGAPLAPCNVNAGDQLTISVANAETNAGPATYIVPVGPLQLVWNDEFNGAAGTKPDTAKWTNDLGGGGWGNNELEVYTDSAGNAHMDGQGNLDIHVVSTNPGYTSARLKTQARFAVEHGRVEARMKIPAGQGIWPAFWMLGNNIDAVGWPKCGEIDIMENIGKEPGIVHGSMHGPGYSGVSPISSSFTLANGGHFTDDFHTFAVQWSAAAVNFYIDGTLYQTVTPASIPAGTSWVFDNPFFLLLNVAVGGNWPGNPDSTTTFPQDMLVDYVRVYQELPVFTLKPWSTSVSAAAATGVVAVTASAYVAWTAASDVSWITVTSGASGTGNGAVAYSIDANATGRARSGTLTIAGQTFIVNQSN